MRKRLAVALVALVALVTLSACSPKGQDCTDSGEGTRLFTSKYGNFICAPGNWPGSLVWKEV